MDVKTTFLNSDLDAQIYIEQSEGFKINGKKVYMCQLKKMYKIKVVI